MPSKTIYLGSDHRGFKLKNALAAELLRLGVEAVDLGAKSTDSVDYPDYAAAVARQIQKNPGAEGILVCGSGLGMSMAANKFAGIRAALCHTPEMAKVAREHNNANIIVFGEQTPPDRALAMVQTWQQSEFQGGRHQQRIDKIETLGGK